MSLMFSKYSGSTFTKTRESRGKIYHLIAVYVSEKYAEKVMTSIMTGNGKVLGLTNGRDYAVYARY